MHDHKNLHCHKNDDDVTIVYSVPYCFRLSDEHGTWIIIL